MLNEYSQQVRDRLLAIFPEFAEYATEKDDYLVIRYPSPDPEHALGVFSDNDEIPVVLDAWHTHTWEDGLDAQIAEAAETIRGIIEGRDLVVVTHKDGKWAGSGLASTVDEVELEPGMTATVRAWSGLIARLP